MQVGGSCYGTSLAEAHSAANRKLSLGKFRKATSAKFEDQVAAFRKGIFQCRFHPIDRIAESSSVGQAGYWLGQSQQTHRRYLAPNHGRDGSCCVRRGKP
jgi:hypothetical protein